MGWAIFTQPNRVMRENEYLTDLHERCHPQSVARIVREHQESGAVRNQSTVQCQPIAQRRHRKFTNAEINIVAIRLVARDSLGTGPQRQIGSRKIR